MEKYGRPSAANDDDEEKEHEDLQIERRRWAGRGYGPA